MVSKFKSYTLAINYTYLTYFIFVPQVTGTQTLLLAMVYKIYSSTLVKGVLLVVLIYFVKWFKDFLVKGIIFIPPVPYTVGTSLGIYFITIQNFYVNTILLLAALFYILLLIIVYMFIRNIFNFGNLSNWRIFYNLVWYDVLSVIWSIFIFYIACIQFYTIKFAIISILHTIIEVNYYIVHLVFCCVILAIYLFIKKFLL